MIAKNNFRFLLQSELERRRTKNSRYSLRAFARDLKVSVSRLSEVMNGKGTFSERTTNELNAKLGWQGIASQSFGKAANSPFKTPFGCNVSAHEYVLLRLDADELLHLNEKLKSLLAEYISHPNTEERALHCLVGVSAIVVDITSLKVDQMENSP